VIVSWLPLYHDMGLIAGFLLPLLQGIPLVLMSPFDWVRHPALLFQAIDRYQGTLCWLPNFAYNHCTRRIRQGDLAGLSLATIRAFINCSEPVFQQSHAAFFERFQPLGLNQSALAVSYAMAENVFAVTQTPIGQPPRLDTIDRALVESQGRAQPVSPDSPTALVKVSCGPAIAGSEITVLNSAGQPLPDRSIGEIAIRSNCMLSEYYQRPDLNADLFVNGRFLTGDLGYTVDGEVFITGRKKDLMIVAGKNVFPQDIEAIVNTVAGVHPGRAVVFGVQDERDGTEVIAIIAESDEDSAEATQQLKRAIRQAIAAQSTVTATYVEIVPPQWIIKTSSGKLARSANREKWLQASERA
jgi:acyl-CoA synthetase (AMP-forming)/AMP-acid ligase II